MPLFQKAAFSTTVAKLRDLPADSQCEVAFAGRSNAGKSSAINTLANHTRLAYVSKTPGTDATPQLLSRSNRRQVLRRFARLRLRKGAGRDPLAMGGACSRPTFRHREQLVCGLVMIMDAVAIHSPNSTCRCSAGSRQTGKPIHVLLTKADKLTRQQQTLVFREVQEVLAEDWRELQPAAVFEPAEIRRQGSGSGPRWLAGPAAERTITGTAHWLRQREESPPQESRRHRLECAQRQQRHQVSLVKAQKKAPGKGGAGGNMPYRNKAPAQGGEAGDGEAIR
jgi:GTP-binding protein